MPHKSPPKSEIPSLPSLAVGMEDFAAERTTLVAKLRRVRCVSIVLGIGNLAMVLFGGYLTAAVLAGCRGAERLPFLAVSAVAAARIVSMVRVGVAQQATAATIVGHHAGSSVIVDPTVRHERRMRYKRWLWWTRIGMAVTVLQFFGALYLMFIIATGFSYDGMSKECFLGKDVATRGWKQSLVVSFLLLVWLVVIIQCFTGSDVLRWRSFYAMHDTAWRAHYQEIFDHGIREALCCMGRVKYLSVLEEDEVYSVARLLGDLVAYRASGTGHLELLAGLALLQRHKQSPILCSGLIEAPDARIREAASFHQFAEAAYTGPLLDFGRNPVLFPCAWLYRQGVLTPWTHNRRPVLEGDNWWRGHAAAFLKYVNLSPEALRHGRVCQTRREAAYFIVVLHDQKSVVIAVRGTETPEDLLTDGLCRECFLSVDDLDGLINSDHLPPSVSQRVLSSFPHYGHSGIVESARELFMQIDGQPGNKDGSTSGKSGFLSSLLGVGCECHGYKVRIVGHSLGGAVATLLGLRLYRRYPDLHVYSYGTLPCVDSIIAEACQDFVTSIVYNDEFSARLSVNSILRLRAAAITALSDASSVESAMITKLACRILHVNTGHENGDSHGVPVQSFQPSTSTVEDSNQIHKRRHIKYTIKGAGQPDQGLFQEEVPFVNGLKTEIAKEVQNEYSSTEVSGAGFYGNSSYNAASFYSSDNLLPFEGRASQFLDASPSSSIDNSTGETPEMFLPGLIIHIIPEKQNVLSLWKSWKAHNKEHGYKAFVADKESFKDIIVTPYMFLDHLPWRCHHALQRVLETRKSEGQLYADMFVEEAVV